MFQVKIMNFLKKFNLSQFELIMNFIILVNFYDKFSEFPDWSWTQVINFQIIFCDAYNLMTTSEVVCKWMKKARNERQLWFYVYSYQCVNVFYSIYQFFNCSILDFYFFWIWLGKLPQFMGMGKDIRSLKLIKIQKVKPYLNLCTNTISHKW